MLLLEDDARVARSLSRLMGAFGRTAHVECVRAATAFLRGLPAVDGAVIDVWLPDGDGLDVLRLLRGYSDAPALVLTGRTDLETIRRAQILGAEYLPKPPPVQNLKAFLARVVEARSRPRAASTRLTSEEYGLSPRERESLVVALRCASHAEAAHELGVSRETLKSTMRRILHKSGARSLRALAADILKL